MGKIKLTKGELKRQRDALRQFERYLPTLQLKKQQLQLEIVHQLSILEKKRQARQRKKEQALSWAALLIESADIKNWLLPKQVHQEQRNIAGVDIPVYKDIEFEPAEYDLFSTPLWLDAALEILKAAVALNEEITLLNQGIAILRRELRVTTQRVNLFEKVKIPDAREAIRRIKIYLGDQTANAVGRSKIAKKKIEALELQEVTA